MKIYKSFVKQKRLFNFIARAVPWDKPKVRAGEVD